MSQATQITKQETSNLIMVGGNCAILAGVLSAGTYIIYLLLLPAKRVGTKAAEILPSFAQNPALLQLEFIGMALIGVFGIGLVPALSKALAAERHGWVRWTSTLATFGFGVLAVSSVLLISRLPLIVNAFVHGDASTKAALAAVWRSSLDPNGWVEYGGVGLWLLVINLTAAKIVSFPRPLPYLGLVCGVLYCLVPLTLTAQMPILILPIVALGAVLTPACISGWGWSCVARSNVQGLVL